MKNRIIIPFLLLLAVCFAAQAQQQQTDTLAISDDVTTHLLLPAQVKYVNTSNPEDVEVIKVVNNDRIIAVQAKKPFSTTHNVTVLQSDGLLKSYIVKYVQNSKNLILDENYKGVYDCNNTIELSKSYTTYLIYDNEISFITLSKPYEIELKLINESPNILGITAKRDFKGKTYSIGILESSGDFHAYYIHNEDNPPKLLLDFQKNSSNTDSFTGEKPPTREMVVSQYKRKP